MDELKEIYDVIVKYWNMSTQTFESYTVTCKKGGLIIESPCYGYKQYVGANIRDIIKGYQDYNIGYWWSKVEPLKKKGYSVQDACKIASGRITEAEWQTMQKSK